MLGERNRRSPSAGGGKVSWKLVFGLSLFGMAMAIGTVFFIPSNIEPSFWLAVFILSAVLIAKNAPGWHFLHGLMTGIANSVWVTAAHILLFNRYIASHPREQAMMSSMPLPNSPRMMMTLVGPVIGVVSGAIIGLLALVFARFVSPRKATAV